MRIAHGVDDARSSVLYRAPLEVAGLPLAAREVIHRAFGLELGVIEVVDRILGDVRENGDSAVLRYNQEIDGVHGERARTLEVSAKEIEGAYDRIDAALVKAMREAAAQINRFHEKQMEHALRSFQKEGIGQQVRPLSRVGMYVPGTRAVYPSTVLMIAIPARVAGVRELVMVTPAQPDASVSPLKLVAAHIAGVSRVFRAGGVQAIAALTYGTESIPRVDKICGPGNVFVTEAKKRVYGQVGLDGVFGPSETVIIADRGADAEIVAVDLLAGAEHDELATAILISTSEELASEVLGELQSQMDGLERKEIARASLEARGGIAVVDSLNEAMELANEFAPEHLCLHVSRPERLLDKVRNAGAVFVGAMSVESIGDFTAGPSHVMPTGGSARFASPLGVQDFLKATSVIA
ncbi:MAG: histidinol dehydrogenase, partial [Dehalococcoidia bacterium]